MSDLIFLALTLLSPLAILGAAIFLVDLLDRKPSRWY
jgi:hypothetical protein